MMIGDLEFEMRDLEFGIFTIYDLRITIYDLGAAAPFWNLGNYMMPVDGSADDGKARKFRI